MTVVHGTGHRSGPKRMNKSDWVPHQAFIRENYVEQGLSVEEVQELLKKKDFHVGSRMLKTRITQWGYCKKVRKATWLAMAKRLKDRRDSGRERTVFKVGEVEVTDEKVDKTLKRNKVWEEDVGMMPEARGVEVSFTCWTPPSSPSLAPGELSIASVDVGSDVQMDSQETTPRSDWALTPATFTSSSDPDTFMDCDSNLVSMNTSREISRSNSSQGTKIGGHHTNQAENLLYHITTADFDPSRISFLTEAALCFSGFPSPDAWIQSCREAHNFRLAGRDGAASKAMKKATYYFEKLVVSKNEEILYMINSMLCHLLYFGDPERVEEIVFHCLRICHSALEDRDPIIFSLSWNYDINLNLLSGKAHIINIESLREAFGAISGRHGTSSPLSMSALYSLVWALSMCKAFEQAEKYMIELIAWAKLRYSTTSINTISPMNTLARILASQGKLSEAVQVTEEALAYASETFSQDHPYLLEAHRRLGMLLESQGQLDRAETMFRLVLYGRMRQSGRHKYTMGSLKDCQRILRKQDKQDEAVQIEIEIKGQMKHLNDCSEPKQEETSS